MLPVGTSVALSSQPQLQQQQQQQKYHHHHHQPAVPRTTHTLAIDNSLKESIANNTPADVADKLDHNRSGNESSDTTNWKLGSLNKSDLYSPHINASKSAMNTRQNTSTSLNRLLKNQSGNSDSLGAQSSSSSNGGEHALSSVIALVAAGAVPADQDMFGGSHAVAGLDDDLYDFSHVTQPSMRLDGTDYSTATDDEEEDINFDYGYGYDYERVIKDRLKVVNQEFHDDTEPPKRKSIVVSFDNAVTAFNIPNAASQSELESEDSTKLPLPPIGAIDQPTPPSPSSSSSVQIAESAVAALSLGSVVPSSKGSTSGNNKRLLFASPGPPLDNNVSKLPLNDTVQKDDPNSFANKIKEAVLRYDEEQQEQLMQLQQHQHLQQSHHNQNSKRDEEPQLGDVSEYDDDFRRQALKNLLSIQKQNEESIEIAENTAKKQQQQQKPASPPSQQPRPHVTKSQTYHQSNRTSSPTLDSDSRELFEVKSTSPTQSSPEPFKLTSSNSFADAHSTAFTKKQQQSPQQAQQRNYENPRGNTAPASTPSPVFQEMSVKKHSAASSQSPPLSSPPPYSLSPPSNVSSYQEGELNSVPASKSRDKPTAKPAPSFSFAATNKSAEDTTAAAVTTKQQQHVSSSAISEDDESTKKLRQARSPSPIYSAVSTNRNIIAAGRLDDDFGNELFASIPAAVSPFAQPQTTGTTSATGTDNNNNNNSNSNNDEKVLIERDGVFELVSADEYTAQEEKKKIAAAALTQGAAGRHNRVAAALMPTGTVRSASASRPTHLLPASSSPFRATQYAPHPPPPRAKTSGELANSRSTSLKTRFLSASSAGPAYIIPTATTTVDLSTESPRSAIPTAMQPNRTSHSADYSKPGGSNRAKNYSPTELCTTPEYAQHYKSPYQITAKIYKPLGETVEQRKKREEEEEEKKRTNEQAFRAWLRQKMEQRLQEQKRKHEAPESEKKSSSNEISKCTSSTEEARVSYDTWLRRKQEQVDKERELQKKFEQLQIMKQQKTTPEERSKAYKEWLSRKLREKNEAVRQERLENRKWMARRRRSRKHQRLSQALEMAHAYGYNSTYYAPGFTF